MHPTTSGRRWPAAGAFARLMLLFSLVTASFGKGAPASAQVDTIARGVAVSANAQAQFDTAAIRALLSRPSSASFDERKIREGIPINPSNGTGATTSIAAGTVNTLVAQLSYNTIGYTLYLDSVTISANVAGLYYISVNGTDTSSFNVSSNRVWLNANQPITLPLKVFLRAFQGGLSGFVSLYMIYNPSGATANVAAALQISGTQLTDDPNYSALNVIMAVGDSTWAGFGATKSGTMLPFLMRDYFNNQGSDARLILKAISGSSSTSHEIWRQAGWYDFDLCTMLWYDLGINDAIQGTGTTQYLANLTAFWTAFHARRPTTKMIVFGPGPLEDDTSETNAAAIRTTAANYVASVNSPYLKYVNLGGSFDRKNLTYYSTNTSTDPTGAHRHPSDAGNAAEMVQVQAQLVAQGITL